MTGSTLWLHIGTHKTGTTSLQSALSQSGAALRAAGIAYFPTADAARLAHLFLRDGLKTSLRLRGALPLPVLSDYAAARRHLGEVRGDSRDMVLSSEALCMLRDGVEAFALQSFFEPFFDRIVPIVVLRDAAQWRASREDQLRKTGLLDLQKSLPDAESVDGEWYYDTAALERFWNRIGPLQQIDYAGVCAAEGGILPAFARAIGQPEIFGGLDPRLNMRIARAS